MISLRGYAENKGISYEAIRKQVARYKGELGDHIIVHGRQQFLDEEAVAFLDERRQQHPVVVYEQGMSDEIKKLQQEKEELKNKIIALQERLLLSEGAQARLEAAETTRQLLEESRDEYKTQAEQASLEAAAAAQALREMQDKLIEAEKQKEAMRGELELYKALPWWKKIRGKQ